jgi:hypothetical protein
VANTDKTRGLAPPFKPGQSGNPGGRPKSLLTTVRAKCGEDGKKLVDAVYVLAMGTPAEVRAFFGESVKRDARARLQAIEWLADRGYGKAIETVEMSGPEGKPVTVTFGGRYKPPTDG